MDSAHLRTDCMLALPKPPFAGLPASSLPAIVPRGLVA